MKDQATTIEQSQRLMALGVPAQKTAEAEHEMREKQTETFAKETVLRGVVTNTDTGEKRVPYARIPIIFTPFGFATQYAYRAMSKRYGADDPEKYNDDYKAVFEEIRSDFLEGVAFARKRIEMKIGKQIKL